MRKIDPEFVREMEAGHFLDATNLSRLKDPSYTLSLFWELRVLLYTGVVLLSSGLGILVYKHIDTIGHQAVLAAIALATIGCYVFCFKKNPPFAWTKTEASGILFDYLLLLGALCLLIFIGYLQYQYQAFGTRYGMATFIPMVLLFITAYYFDHIGVLSMAITNLATWVGIVVTPAKLLSQNDFDEPKLIFTGIALGIFLMLTAVISKKNNTKAHFDFTYKNFGGHLLYISLISGMVHYDNYYLIWLLPVLAFSYIVYVDALKQKSFYFLLALTLYAYGAFSYCFLTFFLNRIDGENGKGYLTYGYFFVTSIWLVILLIRMNKKIKSL